MRCVNILSRLWHAPDAEQATGCSTTGSSEAAMLGGLALKRRWQQRRARRGQAGRQAEPRDGHQRPGLLGEVRELLGRRDAPRPDGGRPLPPLGRGGGGALRREHDRRRRHPRLDLRRLLRAGEGDLRRARRAPGARPGSTSRCTSTAPPGAFVAPFVDPDLEWDFRLPRVASINASGHKYGLVYPGVGWVVWRDAEALPEDLIFWVNYLGDNMPTFALNFSRPGRAGRRPVLQLPPARVRRLPDGAGLRARGRHAALVRQIEELGPFELLTRGDELPVFAFTLNDDVDNFTVFDVSNALRERGWQVPAYTFPDEPHRPRRAPRRRPARLHPRPRRPARRRPQAPAAAPADASPSRCTTRRARDGLPPLARSRRCAAGSHTRAPRCCSRSCSTSPQHSLIDQSLHSRLGAETTNGDGFGIGWYGEGETPARLPQHRAGLERPQPARARGAHPLRPSSSRTSAPRPARRSSRRTAIRSATAAGCGCTTARSASSTRSSATSLLAVDPSLYPGDRGLDRLGGVLLPRAHARARGRPARRRRARGRADRGGRPQRTASSTRSR